MISQNMVKQGAVATHISKYKTTSSIPNK